MLTWHSDSDFNFFFGGGGRDPLSLTLSIYYQFVIIIIKTNKLYKGTLMNNNLSVIGLA